MQVNQPEPVMSFVKNILKVLVPGWLHPPAIARRFETKLQSADLILGGPFKGMRFSWKPWSEAFTVPLPKFLGTYELELIPLIEAILQRPWGRIVDVGAADGYYAIGFALRIPGAKITAFEELEEGCRRLEELALLNGVASRVRVQGRCEAADLDEAVAEGGDVLVMMDVEGFELQLLDPKASPALLNAHILVEAHDCYVPGVGETLVDRFRGTHRVTRISWAGRSLKDLKVVNFALKHYARHSALGWMNERAHPTDWYWFEPNCVA